MVQSVLEKKAAPVNADQQKPSDGLAAARFLLQQLAEWGVTRIYGVIGDATLYVLDELAKQNRITYIPCRHEEAAALAACAEAKLTGRIGVCMATSGPGIVNLLNGLAEAAADRVPVLAVTGQVEAAKIGTRTKQYIDQQRLMGGITELTELVAHPNALPEVMQRLMTEAVVRGTVAHVSVPKELWIEKVHGTPLPYPKHLYQSWTVPEDTLQQLTELVRGAERPVIYVGRGIEAVTVECLQLAEELSAAVVTTLPARSLFPNQHPQYSGGLGQAGSEAASVVMAEADLILLLGGTWWPDEYAPANPKAKVVQVDAAKEMIGLGHPLALGVVGDLREVLPRLLKGIQSAAGSTAYRTKWLDRVKETNAGWKRKLEEEAALSGNPIPPQVVMKVVSDVVSEGAILAIDTGDLTLWFDRVYQAKAKQQVFVSGRWRTLGFALPAAIAAQLANPEGQVVAISGDGGAVQTIMELQTAVEQSLPIVLLIIDNGAYSMEKNRMVMADLDTLGSSIQNPDFVKLAEACGAVGYRVETAEQLQQAMDQALSSRKTALLQVRTAATIVPHTKI